MPLLHPPAAKHSANACCEDCVRIQFLSEHSFFINVWLMHVFAFVHLAVLDSFTDYSRSVELQQKLRYVCWRKKTDRVGFFST